MCAQKENTHILKRKEKKEERESLIVVERNRPENKWRKQLIEKYAAETKAREQGGERGEFLDMFLCPVLYLDPIFVDLFHMIQHHEIWLVNW